MMNDKAPSSLLSPQDDMVDFADLERGGWRILPA